MLAIEKADGVGGATMKKLTARNAGFLFVFLLLAISSSPATAKTPIEAFARMPQFGDMSISPDGKYIAAKYNKKGKYAVIIVELNGNQVVPTYAAGLGKFDVNWTKWGSATRVLVSLGWATSRQGTPVYETRLLAMNHDGSKQKDMVSDDRGYWQVQYQDKVVDFLPNDPEHIIMAYNQQNPRKPRAYRVDIHTGRDKSVQGGRTDITRWMTDRQGRVRLGAGSLINGSSIVEVADEDGNNFQRISTSTIASGNMFYPMGFSRNPDILYVVSNHTGSTSGLYEYTISTKSFGKELHRSDRVDISSVWLNELTGSIRRVSTNLNGVQHKWLDPIAKRMHAKIEEAFPGKSVSIVGASPNDRVWIAHVWSVTDPGQYVVMDRSKNSAASFGPNYPELENVELSPMLPFSFQSRDGLEIPAFLTLPAHINDIEQARKLPLVVMPHGGPEARDYLRFDPWIQLMANRGIAVLQMNFRGSAGYGAAFSTAGYGQWGGKMQDDVTDGAKYLIAEGIADPNRICIFGGSYGGYAALMGAVKTPDLYKCAVGWNGVYDLKKMMRDGAWYVRGGGRAYWETAIGDYSDTKFLESISPAERADEIKIPVLLTAATDDRVVRSSQSNVMASALRRAGVKYEYLKLEEGGHGYRNTETRIKFMTALEEFLVKHLSP